MSLFAKAQSELARHCEPGGTRDDEALARELALGYRAVADVPAAVDAIHEAGVLAADRFDFVGDVLS